MKRLLAYVLCFAMTLGLITPGALAAESGEKHTQQAHESCGPATEVTGFAALKTAVERGSGTVDLVLTPGGDWTATSTVSIPAGKTVHLRAAAGETVTLKRGGSFLNGPLFSVAAGGRLILGSGRVEYTGDTLQQAARQGDYSVYQDWDTGELILDGGAVWGSPQDWTPGENFGDNTGRTAVLYDEDGKQKKYTNTGLVASAALVTSAGILDIWDGAALRNNVTTGEYGAAIQSNKNSTLNLFGGEVSLCAVARSGGDTGRGAVFVGDFNTGNWNTKLTPTDTHFHMYGGRITRNAASGSGNQDGGGVSVETGYMDLYGGEISYNHAGVWLEGANSGDGGGLMVRNYAQFQMWGGSVSHNFAGGYGGGVVAWNAEVHIHGGEITRNKAAYGGGMAIASSNDANENVNATATMDGGLIASNEAINTTSNDHVNTGVGGGICVGSGDRNMGSTLTLTGGEIRQNTAQNGGGLGVYAGGGQAEGSIRNTAVTMSGDFQLTNNFADRNGNGMYIINKDSGNRHYLVTMSGGAKVDTNNPVYFANLCVDQVPVRVEDILTSEGTAAIFEFADSFWNGTAGSGYDKASNGREVVSFAKDVQENKIALESIAWYLKMAEGALSFQNLTDSPQYTIRNGRPIKVNGAVYYRIYASLSDAFAEAADGDILYIYYNTTVGVPAVLEGKHVTLMAESTSSAGRDAGLSGSGREKSCWLETSEYGYHVMRGNFLKYVGGTKGDYAVSGSTATKGRGPYQLETDENGGTAYNVRNDYTITLSGRLYLGESAKGNSAGEGAVIVKAGAALEVGQTATAGMGAGALTFDGNRSAPKEGPMFQTAGTLALHSGVTVKNHSNYSMAHPGAVEVKSGGSLTMDEGVTLSGNVSPVAGAVYVANGGSFTMSGGAISGNDGAMPRYGFFHTEGTRLTTYDTAYWGQPKYYMGAGAVYNMGRFTMKGGSVTGNRGECGALANLGGTMDLQRGTISGNHAQTGTGEGEHSLSITGYTEGASPAIPDDSSAWAANAGSGGGLYQGGGDATVGSGVTFSNNTAQNGGGVAVGKGRDLTRTVSGYTNVPNGMEFITTASSSIAAKEPQYNAAAAAGTAPVALTVKTGASITDNNAQRYGGGVLAVGSGDTATLEHGVILQRNTARSGGGLAAIEGAGGEFSNEVTENGAQSGGGVYVGAGSTVTAKGSLTANEADANGGGAYVEGGDTPGKLTLDGTLVNNNRLNDPRGFGVGVYNDGTLELTAVGGSQPTVSYNDRIYLETGREVTLAGSYDITASGQNANNRLTLDSRETANGTAILKAATEAQATATLASGCITHYTHPMAQNQADKTVLELNSVPVVYYDRFTAKGALGSHHVEVPYASGDNVIFQNFAVGQEYGFEEPSGMSFLRWVTINERGEYLDSDGNVVDSPAKAHNYFAGNTVTDIRKPVYLEAVYGTVSYSANLQIQDEAGNVISDHDAYMGEVRLEGATYNSANGEYTFAMGTPMNVTPVPSSVKGRQTVLQGLTVYEKVSQQATIDDIPYNGSFWTPVAWAEMEQEELDVPGGGPKTVTATGKMTGVTAKSGVDAKLDSEGRFTYTASDTDILVRARFKWAMVRLDIEEADGSASYTGYYDNMHEAITAIAKRIDHSRVNDETYTVTLLAPNSTDENGNEVVLYYGEAGKDPDKCVDNDIVKLLQDGETLRAVYDLGGYVLDYQHFGERNLKKYNMTIRNGSILYHGDTDKIYDPGNDPEGRGPLPAAFRVAEGTLTLENVTIRTTGTPQGGHNNEVYSAKVMEEGTLNIGRGCTLGDVFIYTDREDINHATPERPSQRSGHVTVTNTFVEGRTDLVATLCLRFWSFENQIRRVIALDESVAAREGVSIRRMFALKDVDGDGTDHAQYWFIGTDGRLYKKAAFLLPWLEANSRTPVQKPLTRYWDYANKQGKWEIGDRSPDHAAHTVDGEPSWTGGYPFYYGYYSTYGFNADTAAFLHAQLKDAEGNDLKIDRGTVAFTVSQITIDPGKGGYTDRRNFSGTTGLTAEGSASLSFPVLSEMPVSETLDLENWTAPNDYYVVNATWAGAGQYAPQYADYWNYARAVTRETEDHTGVTGNTIAGSLRLSVQGKNLTDPSVEIAAITPRSAEYIGQKGFEGGYISGPTVGRVIDENLDRAMIPGTDYNIYFAALTPVTADPVAGSVVVDENGEPLVCEYTGEGGATRYFHYIAGAGNTKVYYSTGGEGTKDGMTPANAKDINGAPAGSYSVALEAETLADPNYVGQSGWKNTLFTIKPYNGALSISGPNHIVVSEGESYADNITNAFTGSRSALTVSDRYGNLLDLADCAFTFAPISGSAKLDADGWPTTEGLYNLVVTATGHQNGTMKLPDVGILQEGGSNPNYAQSAAGYLAILITHKQLDVFFVPQTIGAPYTGTIYTSDMVKALDRDDYLNAGGYQVWKTVVNDRGEPLDETGKVIEVTDIPTLGGERSRLPSAQYRVEIGSPQHTPRDVGDYTMVVTDISGSYIGIGTLHITSEKLGDIQLSETKGVYTGVDHTPQVTVTDSGGKVLTLNRDYVIRLTDENGHVVSSPINAGTYTYTAVGINNYVASENETVSAEYTVVPKDLSNADYDLTAGIRGVILDAPTYAITGANNLVISYSLYYNGMTLTRGENADYDHVITKDGVVTLATREPGTYLFTIQGKGNYTGQTTFSLVVVPQSDNGLNITNTQEYTYNGGNFASYNWQRGTNVNWMSEGSTTKSLDPYQFDVALLELADNGTFAPVDAAQPLDAGLYQLILTPNADYAATEGLPSDLRGNCVFNIRRLPVTITMAGGSKVYGEQDPDFARQGYHTNLIGAEANGFYAHDADRITGQFGRNTGEDVRNSGYRYTLGNFNAGDNYVLTVSVETVFRIEPKDISQPAVGGGEDLIHVEKREAMSYTGYGLEPIQSVTYSTPRGQLEVAEQSGYLPVYERWIPGQPGCVPGCELEGCAHGWETMSATPTDVAWYRVTLDADGCVTAPDNYVGSRSCLFEIRAQGGDLELDVEGVDTATYSRDDYTPVVTVKREGFVLAKEYYVLSYSFTPADGSKVQTGSFTSGETKFRDAGVYSIYAAGIGNYVGSAGSVTFTIRPKDLAEDDTQDETSPVALSVAPGQSFVYNGKAQQAAVAASYLEEPLGEEDYTLSYQNNLDAGTASVTVTGQGNYTGSRTLTYLIDKQPLFVEVGNAVKVYGSADPQYSYTLKNQAGTAVAGIRLTGAAGREAGEDVGSYDLDIGTLSAGSNYELSLSGSSQLVISAKTIGDGKSPAGNISAQAPSYVTAEGATVTSLKALPSVTYWAPALGQTTLVRDVDHTVSVTDKDGTALADGAALKDGETYTLTVTAKGSNYNGSFSLKVTTVDADSLISLGENGTYYYRPVEQEVTLTPTAKGTVLKDCEITMTANYNVGTSQVVRLSQKEDGSFTIALTDAGTYTVVATKSEGADKMFFGTVTYVVQPKDISAGNMLGGGEAALNEPEGDFSYTGREVYPTNADSLLVYDGRTIPAAEDGVTNYIVGYSGNVNPGTATVTVYGQGNYSGSRTTTFTVGEIRYQVRYHENGALTGTAPVDDGLYMKGAMATVQGNVGGLTGPAGTVFLGWSDAQLKVIQDREELKGELYVSGSLCTVGEADVTLYAVWAADANRNGIADCDEDKYTVTYTYATQDECTGLVPVDSQIYLSGNAVQVMKNIGSLALDGYLLLGWTPGTSQPETLKLDNSDEFFTFVSSNALYTDGRSFSMGSADLTLYAVWGMDANKNGTVDWMESKVQYFVSYDGNGGAGTLPHSHALTAETLTVTVAPGFDGTALKRSGHVMLGWTVTQEEPLTEAPEEGSYLSSGDSYVITAGDPNPVVFYALWAVDENGNGTPDYEETRCTLTFTNACDEVTVQAMPDAVPGLLSHMTVKLPGEGVSGLVGERGAVFLGWTASAPDAAKVYQRGTRPENMLTPGETYSVTGDAVFYPVWAEPDYHISQYSITITPTPADGGEAKAEGDKKEVLSGENVIINITVKPGYALSQVLINGVAEPLPQSTDEAGRTFRLEVKNIQENKSVVVAFARSEFRVVWPNPTTFNGQRQEPALKVYKSDDTGTTVAAGDYTLSGTFGTEKADYEDLFIHAGTYTVIVEGKEGTQYKGSKVQVPYVINSAVLTAVTLKEGERPYKGTAYADEITDDGVKAGSLTVPAAVVGSSPNGYTALYSGNLNVGTASVVVTGVGDYTGAVSAQFEITPAAGEGSMEAAWSTQPSLTYDGQPHRPGPTVTNSAGAALTENVDYVLEYPEDVVNAGDKTVTVTGKGNFEGASVTLDYTIKQKSLAEGDEADGTAPVTALALADQEYTGGERKPVPTLLYGSAPALTLTENKDFTLSYSGNTAVGTGASVTVTGKGNYTGIRTLTFKIVPAGSGLTAAASAARTYNGAGQLLSQDELGVKQGETKLTLGTDYDVTYTAMTATGAKLDANGAPKNAGTYAVTITAKGGYSGIARTTLTIAPAKVTEVAVDETGFAYDGEPHAPQVQSVKAGTLTLAETDYAVTYQDQNGAAATVPTQAGSYTLVVTGQGNFTGTKQVSFTISKGTVLTVGTVSDRSYDGLPYQPRPQIKAGERVLTENVDYTLTYSEDTVNAGEKTVTVTGMGNYEGAASTVSYAIRAASLTDEETILILVPDQVYTGTALTPAVTATHHTADGRILFLTKGEDADFTVEYQDNLNAGTASVTVKAVEGGNYEGERTATFQITSAGGKNLSVTVDPASLTYNGRAQEPTVTVKDGETVLKAGTDYTVTYRAVTGTLDQNKKPLEAGAYDVAVSGKGNYEGDVGEASLVILPAALGEVTVAADGLVYNGQAQTPAVTVNGTTLTQSNEDYKVVYHNNKDAGMASVTVTGKDNYAGTQTLTFHIQKAELVITPTGTEKIYGEADALDYSAEPADAELDDFVLEGKLSRTVGENVKESGYSITLGTLRETTGNYTPILAEEQKFTIQPKPIGPEADSSITRNKNLTVGYTGNAVDRAVSTVYQTSWGPQHLLDGTDCGVVYTQGDKTVAAPTAPGVYTGTVTGKGNYTGAYTFTLKIVKVALGVSYTDTVTYDGTDWAADMHRKLTVYADGATVPALTADDLTFKQGNETVAAMVNAGTYTIVVSVENYGAEELPFTIQPRALTADMVSDPEGKTYTGSALEPSVTVTDGEASMQSTDYKVEYGNNTNAGTGTVTVTGQNNYAGAVTKTFPIAPATVTITPTNTGKTYGEEDGELAYNASPAVELEGELTREAGENAGSYSFDLSGLHEVSGNYTLALADGAKFTILAKGIDPDAEGITHSGDLTVGYTGVTFDRSIPTACTSALWGERTLVKDRDYTVTYTPAAPTEPGAYTGTVTGIGNYTGSYTFALNVVKSVLGVSFTAAGGDTVTYDGTDWADGMAERLEVYASGATAPDLTADDLAFQKGNETVTAMVNAGAYTIVVSVAGYNAVTLPFTVLPKTIGEDEVTVAEDTLTYNGAEQEPEVTVEDADATYDVTYRNNINTGEAAVAVTGTGNYTGTVEKTFTIAKKALSGVTLPAEVVYNRGVQALDPVADGLTEGVDYTLTYTGDLVRVGTVTVTATARENGNYSGQVEHTYQITPRDLEEHGALTLSPTEMTYTGSERKPMVLVTDGAIRLVENTDYTVVYEDNTAVGTASVTVTGMGNYTGELSGTFTIKATEGGRLVVTAPSDPLTYSGEEQSFDAGDIVVKDGETPLTLGTDYELSYEAVSGTLGDNDAPLGAGVYNLVVTGMGNYDGSVERVSVIIDPAELGKITLAEDELTYNGGARTPAVTVNGITLTESNEDYDLAYQNNTNAGMASVTVTGTGNYAGTQTLTFRIAPATVTITPDSDGKTYGEEDVLTYTASSEVELDGVLSRASGENVGTYSFHVNTLRETTGNYTLALAEGAVFTISAKSLGTEEDGVADGVTPFGSLNVGYTGKPFNQTVSTLYQTSWGTQNLLNGTDCTVTYQTEDGTALAGAPTEAGTYIVTVSGKEGGNYMGSYAFTLTIAKAVLGVSYTDTVTYDGSNWAEGMAARLNASFQGTPVTLTADNLSFERDGETVNELTDAGTYTIVVTTADYDELQLPFTIRPKTLTDSMVTGPEKGTYTYTGDQLEPGVTVEEADCEVKYQNNINVGTATVTVTGQGNYTGTVTKTFAITPAMVTITPTKTGKTYGTADGELTYDASSAVTGFDVQGALTRAPGEEKGEYAFVVSTLRETTGNYTPVLADGAQFTISAKSIDRNSENISHSGNLNVGYTGAAFDRSIPTVYASGWGDLNLTKGTDYTVTYKQNGSPAEPIAAGVYTGTVTGIGNYTGSYDVTLTVAKAVLGVTYHDTVTYDGSNWATGMKNRIAASFNGTMVSLDSATLTFRKGSQSVNEMVDAGSYTLVLSAADYDTLELPFTVLPKSLAASMVSDPAGGTYSGSAWEPAVTVADGTEPLVESKDYVVTYRNNANVGTATVTVTGQGNYTGTVTKTFNIAKKPLTDTDVNISDLTDHIYNGQPYQPRPEVKIGQRVLRENADYTLSYAGDPVNKGTVTVTVTGMGNYSGTVQRGYQITAKALQAQWLTVSPATMTYTGSELKPLALVAHGEVRLIEGTDYDVTYANNTATGTAAVKVTGKGNYTGEISGTFRIVSNVGGLSVSLSSGEAGYTGEDQKPTLTVTADGVPTGEYAATYTYNGGEPQPFHEDTKLVDVGVYTITVNGQGNYAGATVLTVFTIRPAAFTVEAVGEQDYTGGPVTPKPIVIGNGEALTEHVDYMLTYANNVALGENTASVTVTGLGNYAGAVQTVRFTITGAHTLFHVTYDGNGHSAGEPPVDSRNYLSGNTATVLDGARLGRLGAVFLGWSADRQSLVTTRAAEAALTLLRAGQEFAVNANVTLYAVWGVDSDHNGRPDYAEQVFITASAGEGGSIAPDGKRTVTWGEGKVEYTITVDSGYTFSGVSVDGKTVAVSTADAPTPLTKGENGVYTYVFTDVKEDHVILATFQKKSSGGGGGGGGGGGTTVVVEPPQEEEPDTGVEKWLLLEPHDGYLEGRGNGLFGPNDSMTRAEAAMMFYRLLKEKDVPITVSFRDVPEDAWYSRAVGVMASIGLLKGVGGDCFDPNRPITRAEFAVLISRMATWEEVGQVRAYTDISAADWFYGNVQLISYYGWMAGYPDGSFGPQRNISRGEAAKVINAMTRRRADKEAIDREQSVRFDDVPESHWAFYEIMEAAISHGHQNAAGKETWELK